MSDVFTKTKRSEVMSRIRGRGNKDTELVLAALFRRHRITGWRRHFQVRSAMGRGSQSRPGVGVRAASSGFRVRPDFVFLKVKLAVFVDGCFWHACPKHATKPKNNRVFWKRKLEGNQRRDQVVNRSLRAAGWRVLRIWECDLVKAKRQGVCVRRIQRGLER